MKALSRLAALTLVLLSAVSCATLNQKTTLAPLATDFPVSASKSLYVEGRTIGPAQFTATQPFAVNKVVKLPVLQTTGAVDLAADLKAQVGTDYQGVVQLKLLVNDIDSSAIQWIALERNLGITTLLGGAGALVVSVADAHGQSALFPGLILTGVGAAIVGGSYWHEKNGTIDYTFGLSGVKVKY